MVSITDVSIDLFNQLIQNILRDVAMLLIRDILVISRTFLNTITIANR